MAKKYSDEEIAAMQRAIVKATKAKGGRPLAEVVRLLPCAPATGKRVGLDMLANGKLRQVGVGVGRSPIVTSAAA